MIPIGHKKTDTAMAASQMPELEGVANSSAALTITDEQRLEQARGDPDNPPLEDIPPQRLKRRPRAYVIRRALRLSQEQFAARYQIPIGTLRDWEQGRKEPDAAAKAYLRVIAAEPEIVRMALERKPAA